MVDRQPITMTPQDGPLDDMAQFPDIAGPGIVHEGAGGPVVDGEDRLPVLRIERIQEMAGEQQDILAALAQRRQIDGDDGQPIVEVLPESGGLDLGVEIPMGGGDDGDVHPSIPQPPRPGG
ncbi:MAG: hypothetical protein M5R38_14335 [Candidatus Methylomirabilis sp.]|nr:hypothetical protein [Candidatus Methylomirabilis sp.]